VGGRNKSCSTKRWREAIKEQEGRKQKILYDKQNPRVKSRYTHRKNGKKDKKNSRKDTGPETKKALK